VNRISRASGSENALASETERLPGAGRARRLRHGYRVVAVRPRAIPPAERRKFLPPLIVASTAAFGADTADVWRQRLEQSWFERVDRLFLILEPGGKVVGWTSYRAASLLGLRVLYMDTTGVVPAHQRHGLIPAVQSRIVLWLLAGRPWRPLYLVYRTRNPVVWRGLRRRLGAQHVAPPLHAEAPAPIQTLAVAVHEHLSEPGRLDARTLVVHDAYAERGGAVYGELETPRSGDPETDRFFEQRLGPSDAFLIIARTTLLGTLRSRG
jgi:hypothetical protein